MTDRLKIALAQLNPIVGDIPGNQALARRARDEAAKAGADIVLFSELFLAGYPPEDLVLKPAFQADALAAAEELAAESKGGPALLIGLPLVVEGDLYNAHLLIDDGRIVTRRLKHELPNYGVFDEVRVFKPGPLPGPMTIRGVRIGVPICEDIWFPDVAECLAETGSELLLVPNGSPFETMKGDIRLGHVVARVKETGLPLAYLNKVGGQDELVFDGHSFVMNTDDQIVHQLPGFVEEIRLTEWRRGARGWHCEPGHVAPEGERIALLYQAMVLGLGDYVRKNRFPGVLIGLSGGIDSALTAAIAVDSLGTEHVRCVMMPSRYTSRDSLEDAAACARALGVRLDTIPIESAVEAFGGMLRGIFGNRPPDTTEENIQSRIRGVTLMALSNKFGEMVVTTGNKSEMSVGYATLYGDMCGGFNPLKDLYKRDVYAASRWRNSNRPVGARGPGGIVIPERILTKAPSAELRANQTDQDSLPPYDALDDILECLVEKEMGTDEILKRGHDLATVKRIEHLLYVAEYKRRQAPPGVKLTRRNFGRDRRYPITNGFRDAR